LAGEPRNLCYEDELPVASPLTGRSLQVIRVDSTVGPSLRDRLHAELEESRDRGSEIKDTEGRLWALDDSYSIRDAGDRHSFNFALVEREAVTLERVELGELVVTPDRWSVDVGEDGQIVVDLLVTAEVDQHRAIEDAIVREPEKRRYQPVRLIGLREEPISMRFGQCVWQSTEAGARHRLVLVSELGDEKSLSHRLGDPEIGATMRVLNRYTLKLDALIAELETSGVLNGEAVQRIEEAAKLPPAGLWRRYMETDDIEPYWSDRDAYAAG
jgi:hypothetical protein